jgi:hypothetical protein
MTKSAPLPITSPDYGIRAHTAFDLEVTLVKFIKLLFDNALRLDNAGVNFAQPADVPFDYTGRAQTLTGKVPPQVVRGRVPRTLTGELDVDKLPDVPAVIVQALGARIEIPQTTVSVRILANAYDENPDGGGYQDVLNMIEALAIALTSFGQGALDAAYPIVMPIEWKIVDANTFPHFIGELTTQWELPSARPLPDIDLAGFAPAEDLEFKLEHDASFVTGERVAQ